MRRSIAALILGMNLGTLSWWFLNAQFETGVDALQYHRMASSIVQNGLAPWVINPLSYLGLYPGSDSSGVPFLAAAFSLAAGVGISASVLCYDVVLLAVFGLGLFILTRELTNRLDLALLVIPMGNLAFGFFTTVLWSLDERSFNVALAPLFLFLVLPRRTRTIMIGSIPRYVIVGLMSAVMLASHLNFLLLLPFIFLVPLLLSVVRRQYINRRKKRASLAYFALIGLSPLLLLTGLNQLGILSQFGLEYQLETSALFTGASPPIFLLNAIVFLGTRIGPVNLLLAALGILYLATRTMLPSRNIAIGGILLAGFLGLPIVLYSKDLLTPIFVVLGAIGLGGLIRNPGRRRILTVAVAAILIVCASVAFNAWNLNRTSRAAGVTYWAPPGVTAETLDGNLWISAHQSGGGCVYGNNAVLLQQATGEPSEPFCTGLSIDLLINSGTSAVLRPPPFQVQFNGLSGVNPGEWFSSPNLTRMTDDFARLPGLDFQTGRLLLLRYNVSLIVVDLQRPDQVPLYSYQGVQTSRFFGDLWNNLYPLYRSQNLAVFRLD